MQEIRQEDQFQTSYCFPKKHSMRYKQMVSTLSFNMFGSRQLEHTIKTNCIKHQSVDPEICWISFFFRKGFVYDVLNFENGLGFLKLQVLRQTLNILRKKRTFKIKEKTFLMIFIKSLSVARNWRSIVEPLQVEKSLVYSKSLFCLLFFWPKWRWK